MIPDLPESIDDDQRLEFYSKLLGNLDEQSTIHTNWHTHRRNPSVCWICDLVTLTSKILDITDKYITKSALDIETEYSSEDETEPEIEVESLNKDDEQGRVPEYDILSDEEEAV